MKNLLWFFFFGAVAFVFVLESKISDAIERDIQTRRNEIAVIEKEIAELKLHINSAVSLSDIRNFAESRNMVLTNPMDIITLETRRNTYTVRGENRSIVEQIMSLLE
ncbi:MAG: hypothetical protein FWE23_05420 [Chitinivibrionia bacterium]|jgi:hypothetical protein|nr:hypothetical protein [Chitinivibrionia bacterium]